MPGGADSSDAGTARRGVAAGLAACLLVASAVASPVLAQTGSQDEPAEASGTGGKAASAEDAFDRVALAEVDAYRLALLRMRGHLGTARALIRVGAPGAEYHMGEALAAVFRSAEAALDDWNAPFTRDRLEELENAATVEPERSLLAIESAVNAVNGSFAQTGGMDRESVLGLVEALLRGAVANYTAAVSDNEVVDLRKYQTGRGLVTQAEALVRHSTALQGQPGQEALLKVVTLIRQAWPGLMPPPIAFDPATVAERLGEAVATIEEMK